MYCSKKKCQNARKNTWQKQQAKKDEDFKKDKMMRSLYGRKEIPAIGIIIARIIQNMLNATECCRKNGT
jgi:hypothetical protein